MSAESGPDIVQSCLFTHAADNRGLSVPDQFSPTGNAPYGLGTLAVCVKSAGGKTYTAVL